LDSLVNLLLFGTSFTKQPRIKIEDITEASKSGVLQARIDDLATALRNPGKDERFLFFRELLRSEKIDARVVSAQAGVFLLSQLQRVLQEQRMLAERAKEVRPVSPLDRASLFHDRGVSLDTGILADFSIDQTLRDLKKRGMLKEGQIARVGVIGPGLDFTDKNPASAYDYYPPQTIQPFAIYDSLLRLGLAKEKALSLSIFDISSRVIDHFNRGRERAARNTGYIIQLPRDTGRPWPPNLVAYWQSLGDHIGTAVAPIPVPQLFQDVETRAVRIRPDVVLACETADFNIIVERLKLRPSDRFDLLVATNVFVYYDAFEQRLALENAGAMLNPGRLLLTNDRLPETPGGAMRLTGITDIRYDDHDLAAHETVGWYQKR
jgi:hypothetical protein